MKKLGQKGSLNLLLIPLILVGILLIVALVMWYKTYQSEQDYKHNSDQKVAVAVEQAKTDQQKVDNKQFAEDYKQPLKTYKGPSDYGSLVIKYPKTWSTYVDVSSSNNQPVDGYGYPGTVPGNDSDGSTAYALRFQVVNDSYDQEISNFQNQLQQGEVSIKPYKAKLVPSVVGAMVTGAVQSNKQGTMILLPLRDKTLEIWTEAKQFENDFNNIILPNFSFQP